MSRLLIALVVALLASAQAGKLPGAAQTAGTPAELYRLDAGATYWSGCMSPCRCASGEPTVMRGTFELGPAMPGDVVDFRQLRNIYWTVFVDGINTSTITGDGLYRITNFDEGGSHSLELNLSVDGAPSQYFFSDLVPLETKQPTIDIEVSLNGFHCYDNVLHVIASPVPTQEIVPYGLIPGSTFQQGCFDPCDCLLEQPRQMLGGFSLVPLFLAGNYSEYALVNIDFSVPGAQPEPEMIALYGTGRYFIFQGIAGPIQNMQLALNINEFGPVLFDREYDNATTLFPDIDINVDMNDMVCFDQILNLNARPLGPIRK